MSDTPAPPARSLFQKIWEGHQVVEGKAAGATAVLIAIDRVWLHERTGGVALAQLEAAGRAVRDPGHVFVTMDHVVDTGSGDPVHVPLRIVQNGDGAEVMLTLFRQPGMDDERFSGDAKWVMRDLRALSA